MLALNKALQKTRKETRFYQIRYILFGQYLHFLPKILIPDQLFFNYQKYLFERPKL